MEIIITIVVILVFLFIIRSFNRDGSEQNQTQNPVYQKPEKPQWIHLSNINFGDGGPLKRAEAKQGFRDYLFFCGFSENYIADAMEDFSAQFNDHFEKLRTDIADTKENIKECKGNIRELKKQIKLDKPEEKLEGEALSDAIENTEIEIEAEEEELEELEEHLPGLQSELKAIKADWKPYLFKYIENNTSYGWVLKNKPETMKEG